jgi:hypothetical protein
MYINGKMFVIIKNYKYKKHLNFFIKRKSCILHIVSKCLPIMNTTIINS